jgi:hypothetical protein
MVADPGRSDSPDALGRDHIRFAELPTTDIRSGSCVATAQGRHVETDGQLNTSAIDLHKRVYREPFMLVSGRVRKD